MISLSLWVCECVCTVLCLVTQSCPTLCEPVDCSLPGCSVHSDSPGKNTGLGCHALLQGIFPTQGSNPGLPHCRWILYHLSHQGSPRILEWVAYTRLIKTIIDFFFLEPHHVELPCPGIEPISPAFEVQSLNLWISMEFWFFFKKKISNSDDRLSPSLESFFFDAVQQFTLEL